MSSPKLPREPREELKAVRIELAFVSARCERLAWEIDRRLEAARAGTEHH